MAKTAKRSAKARKKGVSRGAAARTSGAGNASARKATGRKTSARKTGARTPAGRKTTARKATARTTAARKTSARQVSPKPRTGAKGAARRQPALEQPARKQAARKQPVPRATSTRRAQASPEPTRLETAATAIRGAVAGAVAAVSSRLPWGSDVQDGLQMLEQDHRRFEELLKQGEDTTEAAVARRSELLDTITRELEAHEVKEETVLYPTLKAHPAAKTLVLEGYQEHHVADVLIDELHTLTKDDERWGAKFAVLKENIEHHIQEEEREMFRIARGLLTREELLALGDRMAKAARS